MESALELRACVLLMLQLYQDVVVMLHDYIPKLCLDVLRRPRHSILLIEDAMVLLHTFRDWVPRDTTSLPRKPRGLHGHVVASEVCNIDYLWSLWHNLCR
ncbi:Os04g0223150 [Oryza sativa Japonica Group]|uniref:Os04g0223150 protein n=1 Tax=Oryza sativa subsp. japonica TaxID=39947 RepID=A0A0P0W8E6_ORYSJ|nr:Os04g0223150 [Oryza sativa Japonica Group]